MAMGQDKLRVLLVGKGGREHALAWKLAQSPTVAHVHVFPGNGGTARGLKNVSNVSADISIDDYAALVEVAKDLQVGLVVVGPDDAIVDGIEGFFRAAGIPCFAPSKEAAEIEGSKTFAKDFMKKYCIPTAAYGNFSDLSLAKAYVEAVNHDVVIKASGLAAGKGVVLPATKEEALKELEEFMGEGKFGAAGSSVVIEERLEGDEISVLTFFDGSTMKSFPPAQDHKRIFEGNQGPNTGGMGVYAPVPFVSEDMMLEIERKILEPTFEGMKAEGRAFSGMLFTGVMLTASGPKVLEYNARFGDPETQSVVMLLSDDTDLAHVLLACTQGTLAQVPLSLRSGAACNVVITSAGYPGSYVSGHRITLVSSTADASSDVQIFHAGTKLARDELVTNGGRVFSVAAFDDTLADAVRAAYEKVGEIQFEGMYFRKDIAHRGLKDSERAN